MNNSEQNNLEFRFKCIQCGNCCRVGFEVVIEKEDVEKWIKLGKADIFQYIQIDPKCISLTGLAGYHIEEINALEKLKEIYDDKIYRKKLEKLKEFILNNHIYLGKGPPLPIYTFLSGLGRTPILTPKNSDVILEGLEWGLIYILKFEPGGYCPFLRNNLCSIHEVKPNVCKLFPYNKEGQLKIDDFFLKICKGINKNSS